MRVLICGGRDYGVTEHERLRIAWQLSGLHVEKRFTFVIDGGARGVDACAREFREMAGLEGQTFKAEWLSYGRAAGPIRNQRMIDEGKPDLVIAFPGGRGTADMVRRARAADIEVREIS